MLIAKGSFSYRKKYETLSIYIKNMKFIENFVIKTPVVGGVGWLV